MTIVRVKGFQIFKDRHGKSRCYHRASGTPIDLEKYPIGTLGFLSECNRINERLAKKSEPKSGTLGKLISEYRASSSFSDLAALTRRDYQRVFQYLKPLENTLLSEFTPATIVKIRDTALSKRGRRFANYVKTVFSLLFSWGRERGFMENNPALRIRDIKRHRDAPRANRPWTDEECQIVLAEAPPHLRLPIALMMYTALGPKDALKLLKSSIQGDEIILNRSKTNVPVRQTILDGLKATINDAPKHTAITICANSNGLPWTVSGFNSSWQKLKSRLQSEDKIGPSLTLYGLRHRTAHLLREMGLNERQIADWLGQKSIEMARHYSRGADLSASNRKTATALNEEMNNRRTKVVKP